jgi:hypothetical protein
MSDRYLPAQREADRFALLQLMLDEIGVQSVLMSIAIDCHARADASRSHPYASAQWRRREKAIAQLAETFTGED